MDIRRRPIACAHFGEQDISLAVALRPQLLERLVENLF